MDVVAQGTATEGSSFPLALKEAVLAALQFPIFVWRQPDELIYWNPAAATFLQTVTSAEGQPLAQLSAWRHQQSGRLEAGLETRGDFHWGGHHWQAVLQRMRLEGEAYDLLQLAPAEDVAARAELEALRTQLHCNRLAQKRLEYLLRHDPLTDLLNRQGILERLAQQLEASASFTLLFVDLDGFKSVNDALGHQAGDRLLEIVAQRLRAAVGSAGEVARFAGDEFLIFLPGALPQAEVEALAETLLNEAATPFELDEYHTVNISASIGIYRHQVREGDVETILARADYAMYEAKRRGKNRYVMFDGTLHQRMALHGRLLRELDQAFEQRAFYIQIQPVYHADGTLASGEVLVRWEHDEQPISPAVFIPMLERRGLIQRLTYYVLEEVIRLLSRYPQIPFLTVNLSLQLFYEEGFLPWLERQLAEHPHIRGKVGFEVAESVIGQDPDRIIPQLNRMHAMGFALHIDDFGASYASLASIRALPAQVLKIAPDFVRHLGESERDSQLLSGMIDLARRMKMAVVVEGVETEEQRRRLEAIHPQVCMQGYCFGQPLSSQAFVKLMH